MLFDFFARLWPESWLGKIVVAPLHLLLAFLYAWLVAFFVFPTLMVYLIKWVMLRILIQVPSERTFAVWARYESFINLMERLIFDSTEGDYFNYESTVEKALAKNPRIAKFLFSREKQSPELIAVHFKAMFRCAETHSRESEAVVVVVETIHEHRHEIASAIMGFSPPEGHLDQSNSTFTPYFRFTRGYSSFYSLLDGKHDEALTPKLREIFNALYRPVFHLQLGEEGEDCVLIARYSSGYDTLEGHLYEQQLSNVPFVIEQHPRTWKILRLMSAELPESDELPVEWRLRLAESFISERIDKYLAEAAWSKHELSRTPLTYWASIDDVRKGVYWGGSQNFF